MSSDPHEELYAAYFKHEKEGGAPHTTGWGSALEVRGHSLMCGKCFFLHATWWPDVFQPDWMWHWPKPAEFVPIIDSFSREVVGFLFRWPRESRDAE